MDNLVNRYKGQKTGQGHELSVKRQGDVITIGFQHLGEYQDDYDPFIRVARIEPHSRRLFGGLVLR